VEIERMPYTFRTARVALVLATVVGFAACSEDTTSPSAPSFTVKGSASAPPSSVANLLVHQSLLTGLTPRFDHSGGTVVGNPSKVGIGMYAFYLSQNEDCSAAVQMADNGSTPVVKDFTQNPVLFTGAPPAGTYKCVVLRISDAMHFESANAGGGCAQNTDYAMDIYRAPDNDWKDVMGDAIVATGSDVAPSDDKVYLFASINPAAVIARGISPNQTLSLTSTLTVPGTATFYWDATNTIDTDGTVCGMEPPSLSFR
jgi:hypothetical protein